MIGNLTLGRAMFGYNLKFLALPLRFAVLSRRVAMAILQNTELTRSHVRGKASSRVGAKAGQDRDGLRVSTSAWEGIFPRYTHPRPRILIKLHNTGVLLFLIIVTSPSFPAHVNPPAIASEDSTSRAPLASSTRCALAAFDIAAPRGRRHPPHALAAGDDIPPTLSSPHHSSPSIMEALAVSAYPVTPQTSHLRSSSQASRAHHVPAQEAARAMQQHADAPEPVPPLSQESFASAQSAGSSNGPRLQSSSSNGSQLTNYSDLTSPVPNTAPNGFNDRQYAAAARPGLMRRRTPEDGARAQNRGDDFAVTSPMSLASPATTNGAKRTASGHVKNAPSLPGTPLTATFAGHRSRTDSISSTGSRAGELAASLKTRLGYAMHKVQNGWEHKDINEVEKLAAYKAHANRHSMSHLDSSRRPGSSGLSNGTERLSMHEAYMNGSLDGTSSPPPKRHSGVYSSFTPSSQPTLSSAPRLQPAADIRPTSSTHPRHYHTAPSSQTNIMSPPRTPSNSHSHAHPRRPPTIRTDTQTAEAERDALQALFQLGSPHTSQQSRHFAASQASSSQASPLRSEFAATPRRVSFARSESDGSNAGAQRSSDEESSATGPGL